jgi:hypothetical protein
MTMEARILALHGRMRFATLVGSSEILLYEGKEGIVNPNDKTPIKAYI